MRLRRSVECVLERRTVFQLKCRMEQRRKFRRLLLPNISERYSLCKSENADMYDGFSAAAFLRPKSCIPMGSGGSHNVCMYLPSKP